MSGDTHDERRRWWLALRAVPGVGNLTALALVRALGGPREAFAASRQTLLGLGVRPAVVTALRAFDRWAWVDAQLARLERLGGRLLVWSDEDYPPLLREIHDPPMVLFAVGKTETLAGPAVALAGARRATPYGRRTTRRLAAELAAAGITIVSGLARGIDACAHAGALEVGGRTAAVLGSGVDVVYPAEHKRLHMEVARQGCIVSEYPLGTRPEARNFPERNRIISGLCRAVVVVEAAEKSGSLITARLALEQGRDVFAVPGPIGAATRGSHRLLREGAILAESAADIVGEIAPQLAARQPAAVPERNAPPAGSPQAELLARLPAQPAHVDEIAARAGLDPGAALALLLELELGGLVEQMPGKYFRRTGGPPADAGTAE